MMVAAKQVLPFLALFYAIDFFLYFNSSQSSFAEESLWRNIFISSLFILGFFAIDFFRARSRMKSMMNAPPQQVIVVQQPVYIPAQGYGYPPYGPPGAPQQQQQLPPQGQAYYPPYPQNYGEPPPQQPPPAPPPQGPRRRPPEGSP